MLFGKWIESNRISADSLCANSIFKLQCKWLSFLQLLCMKIPLIQYSIHSKSLICIPAYIIFLSTSSISSLRCHFSHITLSAIPTYTIQSELSVHSFFAFAHHHFLLLKQFFAFIEAPDVIWRCFYIAFWIVNEWFFAFNADFGIKRQLCFALHKKKCKT